MDRHHGVSVSPSFIPHIYDRYRPIPPRQIYSALLLIAKKAKPELVVDLGCGTGISTRPWGEFAEQVLGIDLSIDMIKHAKDKTKEENVSFLVGRSSSTGVADQTVDIVTCSSSIHWMEPASTFQEIDRILKPDGLLAAYGPKIHLSLHAQEVGEEFNKFLEFAKKMDRAEPNDAKPARWDWAEIIEYAKKRDGLKYVDELSFSTVVEWDAHHFFEWLSTLSYATSLMKIGQSEFNKLKLVIKDSFADRTQPLFFSYRLLIFTK